MKINTLETHDRNQHFVNQNFEIAECCQDLINKRPFGNHPFYIFAHARTIGMDERFKLYLTGQYSYFEQVPSKTIIWQPRLTKPEAQSNSMLFKAYPGTDNISILWIIPQEEFWDQYEKGKVSESNIVYESIQKFKTNKKQLEKPEKDDLTEEQIKKIYEDLKKEAKQKGKKSKLLLP